MLSLYLDFGDKHIEVCEHSAKHAFAVAAFLSMRTFRSGRDRKEHIERRFSILYSDITIRLSIFFLHARVRQVVIIGARARAAPYRLFLVDLELDDLTCVVVVVDLRTDASGACRDVLVHQQSGDRDLNMKSTS
jgi:hypothetical protein